MFGMPIVVSVICLNPCFSGCWSRTRKLACRHCLLAVLILVLVDVGLGHEAVRNVMFERFVLILVLVDVGLGHGAAALSAVFTAVLILVLVDVGLGLPRLPYFYPLRF